MDQKEISAMLATNKQHLQLLNQQVRELRADVASDEPEYWDEGQYPYFYAAVDIDGEPGIVIPSPLEGNKVYEGLIRIQSDAPFVVTHIMTALRPNIGRVEGGIFSNIASAFNGVMAGGPQSNGGPGAFPDVEFGFVDEGSGRQLFQAERQDTTQQGNPVNKDQLLSPAFFNTNRLFRPDAQGSGATAPGHGPNFPYELTSECMLPANDVVRVLARPLFSATFFEGLPGFRVYVTLHGYKVLGD